MKLFFKTDVYLKLVLIVLCFALFSAAAYAQGGGTIVGTVTDPSGAAVPGAKITLTNLANGFTRTTESNSTGGFTAASLGIGEYTMKVEAKSFKTYTQKGINVTVNETTRADAQLAIGAQTESVTVEASVIQVQSDTSDVSQAVTDTQVSQLATNGRNILQLTALVPGAASNMPDFDVPVAQYQSRAVQFNGQRADHNQWIIDGAEAYDRGGGGIMLVSPSQDSIAEFKVTTSNYSADLGGASGGMVSMAMKQGTKTYHGSVFEYNRNDALNSFSWGAKNRPDIQNAKKNKMRYNTYGFNFGGPLNPKAKDPKTFFFYNMEWRNLIQGGTSSNRALTAIQRDGNGTVYDLSAMLNAGANLLMPTNLSASEQARWAAAGLTWTSGGVIPNAQIPVALVNANARRFLATGNFPLANTTQSGNPVYMVSADKRDTNRQEAVRLDRQFTDKLTVWGHFIFDHQFEHLATPLWQGMTYPTVGTEAKTPAWTGVVHATYAISPTLLNDATFNTNGNNLVIDPSSGGGTYLQPSGWTGGQFFPAVNAINKLPGVNVGGGASGQFGMNYDIGRWPWDNTWRSYQVKDDVSWSHGTHNIRFGGDYLWNMKMQFTDANVGGNYGFFGGATGVGFADFLLGYAGSYSQPQVRDAVNIKTNTLSAYGVDDWKVTKRLTLNLGLRWEGLPAAYDVNGRLSNFYPELYNPAQAPVFINSNSLDRTGPGFTTVSGVPLSNVPFYMNGIGMSGRNGVPKGMFESRWYNFAPRIGFAYDITGKGTVLRGGFSQSFNRTAGNEQYNMMNLVPFIYTPSVSNILLDNPNISWIDGSNSSSGYPVASVNYGAAMTHKIPTTNMWNLGVQQGLGGKAVLNVTWVGNNSIYQPLTLNINDLATSDRVNRLRNCGATSCTTTIGGVAYGGFTSGQGAGDTNLYRPYKGWGSINNVYNIGNANYNGLQVSLRSNTYKNLTLGASWTYSHAFDLNDGDLWSNVDNPFDLTYNWGSAGFDRRHVVNITYVYDMPFFKHSSSKATKAVLGGWTLSGVVTAQSGNPATIGNGVDNLGYGGNTNNHAMQVGTVVYKKTKDQWFNGLAKPFVRTTVFDQWGSSARSAVINPGRFNFNTALFKNFQFTERVGLEFRFESFNTFNMTQWTSFDGGVTSTTFGKVTGAADPRIFQLGARISF